MYSWIQFYILIHTHIYIQVPIFLMYHLLIPLLNCLNNCYSYHPECLREDIDSSFKDIHKYWIQLNRIWSCFFQSVTGEVPRWNKNQEKKLPILSKCLIELSNYTFIHICAYMEIYSVCICVCVCVICVHVYISTIWYCKKVLHHFHFCICKMTVHL